MPKRRTTSVTVDLEKDAKRQELGIKLSTALDIGLDLIFKKLSQNKKETDIPIKKEETPEPEPVDKDFNQKLLNTIKDASQRYKISSMQYDSPFEDDNDFLHYLSKRAKQIHVEQSVLERCVVKYIDGEYTPKKLMELSKQELVSMGV